MARILGPGFNQFTEADGLESRVVVSAFEDHDGTLYAVTAPHHTLNQFDGERFTRIRPRIPASVRSFGWGEREVVLQDRKGEWWFTSGFGLLRYPKVAKAADLAHTAPRVYRQRDGLPDDSVIRVFEDSLANIWIGTASGVSRWNSASETMQDLTRDLWTVLGHTPGPHGFAEDAAGQIWIGFYSGGLVRFRAGRFESITDGLPAGVINFLLVDHKGRLWVASSQGGVGRIDEPSSPAPHFRRYTDAEGLRSKHIFALAEDHNGRIYIGGGQGVDLLDPVSNSIEHYPASGGLPPGGMVRLHTDRQGAIWFASNFGLSRYIPKATPAGAAPPPPTIREIRVSGVPILRSDEGEAHVRRLKFPAGRDPIEIAYGSVDFSILNSVRYRYRLAGLETEWQPPTSSRSAQYAAIGSGSYTFEVQAVNSSGLPSALTATVEFDIQGPFWSAGWFRTLAGAFLAALVFAVHRYRVRHLLALERVRAHLAADLHDDLGSGLAEIAILTEVAKQRGNSEELEVVAQRARELRSTMGDIVWSVDPEFDNLDGLIRRWRQTAFALLGNDRLEFVAPASEQTARIELTPQRRRHLLLLFKEVVTNVARHAQGSTVRIEVQLTPTGLNLEIRDDGCGFVAEATHSGNGLKNIVKRADALGASVRINSQPGSGTAVSLTAPFKAG